MYETRGANKKMNKILHDGTYFSRHFDKMPFLYGREALMGSSRVISQPILRLR